MVKHFPGDPLPGLRLPEDGVEVREVVVDVDAILGPLSQGPAAQLRTLRDNDRDRHTRWYYEGDGPIHTVYHMHRHT